MIVHASGGPHTTARRALIFHDTLFARGVGSTEKILVDLGRAMAEVGWDIWFASAMPVEKWPAGLWGIPFGHDGRQGRRPYRFTGMRPCLDEIRQRVDPDLFISPVWDRYQFPFIDLPPDLPVIQFSPFGSYCPYGDVRHVWVQSVRNLRRVRAKGAPSVSQIFNPMPVPPIRPAARGQTAFTFGRAGRADVDCFDPIALDAYALVEREFGDRVRLWWIGASQKARDHAADLGLKNIQFTDWLEGKDLEDFYQTIDVFCHSRKDGETSCSIAIVEAMLAQNPVITHRSRHHNDHIDGPLGIIMRVGNTPEEYAAHMAAFVLNRGLTAHEGLRSRNIAEQLFGHGWDKILREIDAAMVRRPGFSVRRVAYRAAGTALSMAGA